MMTWALYRDGIRFVPHLDYFLVLVPLSAESSADIPSSTLAVFSHLGVPISKHKTEGLACILVLRLTQ